MWLCHSVMRTKNFQFDKNEKQRRVWMVGVKYLNFNLNLSSKYVFIPTLPTLAALLTSPCCMRRGFCALNRFRICWNKPACGITHCVPDARKCDWKHTCLVRASAFKIETSLPLQTLFQEWLHSACSVAVATSTDGGRLQICTSFSLLTLPCKVPKLP